MDIRIFKTVVFSVMCFVMCSAQLVYANNSRIDGIYIVNRLMDNKVNTGGSSIVTRIRLTFDGAGSGAYETLESSVGVDDAGSFSYNVSPDGILSIDGNDEGIVSPDGHTFVISNADSSDDAVFLGVGIKQGTGLSNSTLKGTYINNQFMDDEVNTGGYSIVTRQWINSDGAGSMTYETLESSVDAMDAGSYSHNVSSDGIISIDGKDGDAGIISPDGYVFTISDADPYDDDAVFLMVGIKLQKDRGDSSSSSSSSSSGCFIGTTVYGTPMAAEIGF